jgi:cytochrome P450/nitrite reductase/ring-hydroxylating ferredoxin subunit
MADSGSGSAGGWVRVGAADAFEGVGPFGVTAGGAELVLLPTADGLRAFDGHCPHQGALLAEGELEGDALVCRNHRWRFDARTGARRGGDGCLRACPLEARGGDVLVRPEALQAATAIGAGRTVGSLPGPRGLPLLGAPAALDLDRLHLTLERWAARFGSVYRVALGPTTVVAISDPALIQPALRERPGAFRRLGNVEPVFRELGIDGVFSAEGAAWRPWRRLTMEALSPRHLRAFYPTLRAVAERLHRRWVAEAAGGLPVDVVEDFKRFTVDLTTQLAFGRDLDTLEAGDDVLQRRLEQVFPGVNRRLFAAVPLWRLLKLPAERRLEAAVAEVLELLRGLLREARARLEAEPGRAARPETFLEAMIMARDEAGRPYREDEILGNAIQILLGGEDTTALTLSWAVHELCDHPEAAAALQAEADRVLGGALAPTDLEAVARLEVAGAVASETMRLRPVAPLLLFQANEDVKLGDLLLPRGQTIALLMRLPAVDAAHFADPGDFRPERWLHLPAPGPHDPSANLPFGSGPRLCPGRSLALLELRVALATLARGFDVERIGRRADVEERFAFTMGPRGLRVRLRTRQREGLGAASSPPP